MIEQLTVRIGVNKPQQSQSTPPTHTHTPPRQTRADLVQLGAHPFQRPGMPSVTAMVRKACHVPLYLYRQGPCARNTAIMCGDAIDTSLYEDLKS